MAENIEMTLKPVNVTPDQPATVDTAEKNPYSDEQVVIARKIYDAAIEAGIDPKYALSIAHIENNFNTGPSPTGAAGPMQLTRDTANYLGVDRDNIDENIKGGIAYLKEQLNKYGDPYMAGIAYNGGPGMTDKFIKTGDSKVLSDEAYNYYYKLRDTYKSPDATDQEEPAMKIEEPKVAEMSAADKYTEALDKTAAAGAAVPAAAYAGHKIKKSIEAANIADEAALSKAESKLSTKEGVVRGKESTLAGKQEQLKGRVLNQTSLAEDAQKNAERLRAAQLAAEERLAKATDNARRYGVLEEVVKTTPGGVTQQGGLGSGAMRHANVMGEVHEANVVRKGTETAGPGYSQKSRLIVPDKYAGASVYNPKQIAAQKELAAAEAGHQRLIKAADKAEGAAQGAANKLRDITEKGPSGLTAAEQQLKHAKDEYERVKKVMPSTSKVVKLARAASKVPFTFIAPAAFGAMDAVETANRLKRGEYGGAAISGVGALGGALSMVPPIGPLGAAARLSGLGLSLAAPAAQYVYDKYNAPAEPEAKYAAGGAVKKFAWGGKVGAILEDAAKKLADSVAKKEALSTAKETEKAIPTVRGRERIAFPKVYRDPRVIVNESADRVSKESPLLKQLFGVDRYDLDAMTREMKDNLAAPYYVATRPPEYLAGLQGKKNTQRLQDVLEIAQNEPRFAGSYGWYQSDPLKQRFIQLNEHGARDFDRFSQLGAALSPSTAVPKEIERSSVAYLMDKEGRLSDFLDPRNMPKGYGHAYHTTAHNAGVRNLLERGDFRPEKLNMAPKTRVYYGSRTGENLDVPTADAHFVRGVGLADLRPATKADDFGSSISATELDPVTQWYRRDVASPIGMRASPAQALQWNAMGTSTGVETELGVPFLELLSRRIGNVAASEGTHPSIVRDEFIRGERHLAEGGLVRGYDTGGDVDTADYYGHRLDASNSDMTPAPIISDKGNVVRNIVAQRNALADKYLGGAGRPISKGLSTARQFLNDEVHTHTSPGNRFGDWTIGQMPEAIYDYTTAGMPGPVLGNEWVPNTAAGGMMHTDPYGDIRGLDLLNLVGAEVPFVAAGKAAYKSARPLVNKLMNPPVAVMESTSPGLLQNTYRMRDTGELANDPAGLALTDERAQAALGTSGLDKYNVTPGQGAWGGNSGSEFNRAYAVTLPRLGPLSKYDSKLAQFGSDTDQMMMSSIRFTPQKESKASTAIKINNVSEQDIINLNKKLGDDFVVQHRPKDKTAVIYNWTDKPKQMGALEDTIYGVVPNKKLTFGTYESSVIDDYSKFNVKPKTPKLIDIEKRAARRESKRKK